MFVFVLPLFIHSSIWHDLFSVGPLVFHSKTKIQYVSLHKTPASFLSIVHIFFECLVFFVFSSVPHGSAFLRL